MNQQGVDGNPQLSTSFSSALFGAVFSMTCSHKEAELFCCSGAAPPACEPPLRLPVAPGKKRALFRSTWIYVGEPEAAGDGNCWPSGLAVARGFWQGSKWTQWVTLSFPVSLPFYSLFTVSLSAACLHLLPLPSCQNHFLQ